MSPELTLLRTTTYIDCEMQQAKNKKAKVSDNKTIYFKTI